jgi:hypothetical protein
MLRIILSDIDQNILDEVFTLLKVYTMIFWALIPYGIGDHYECFGGTYLRWRQKIPLKHS